MDGLKITGIVLQDFGCFELYEATFGPGANIIYGDIAKGKSTLLNSLRFGLESVGVDASAIRLGAEKASVLVNATALNEALKIRRSITASGSTLAVTNDKGDKWAKPQTRLSDMLGSTLDPLAFYLAKPEERRRQILAAMPVTVTEEDLMRWTGDDWTPAPGKHGLEVVADVRKCYYDKRTAANKAAKDAEAAAKLKADDAARLQSDAHKGVVVPLPGEENAPVVAAEKAREALEQRRQQAEAMAKRTEGTRAKIAALRAEQAEIESTMGEPPSVAEKERIEEAIRSRVAVVEDLKRQLLAAEQHLMVVQAEGAAWSRRMNEYNRLDELAGAKQAAAEQLESTLAEAAIEAPTPDELLAAEAAIVAARTHADLVRSARAAHAALAEAAALADEAKAAKEEADRLDAIVTTLTTTAPAELAARSETIPGLAFADDGGITLDGKSLNRLSGAEQMYFAIDLAKRVSKGKVLIVDELHRLPESRMLDFARHATKGGFQFIGAYVTDGELKIVAIEPEEQVEAKAAPSTKPASKRLTLVMPEDEAAK